MPGLEETKLLTAADEALKVISHAEGEATVRLASAAKDAGSLIAAQAEAALKVVAEQNDADHTLLIRLEERMEALKIALKEIKEGLIRRVDNHEERIICLEKADYISAGRAGISTPVLIMIAGLVGGLVVFIIQQIITK